MCGRAVAALIGLLGVTFSIGSLVCLVFFTHHFGAKSFCIIVLALNIVACIRWIWGIIQRKTISMVVPLVWWSILLVLWILAATYFYIRSLVDEQSDIYEKWTPIIAVVFIFFYIGAITSFIAMKNEAYRNTSKTPNKPVTYANNAAKESSGLLAQTP